MSIDPTRWVKARASGNGANCVEMRQRDRRVEVRDTKQHGEGPVLGVSKAEFAAWLDAAKRGEFDHFLS